MNTSLIKKEINIESLGEYVMFFDMTSLVMYKEKNKSFIGAINKLLMYDDATILDFIACTLRKKSNPDKPVGFEEVEKNPILYLLSCGMHAVNTVVESFPENNKKKE